MIVTNGFGVFKDQRTVELIRFYAKNGGIIILTDSDSAGFKIRGHIKGIVSDGTVRNAYIPDIYGKERRKAQPSAEGKLGVEGVPDSVIISALSELVDDAKNSTDVRKITHMDLYEDGLTGAKDSSAKRQRLISLLSLPERLTANSLLDALNTRLSYDEYKKAIKSMDE